MGSSYSVCGQQDLESKRLMPLHKENKAWKRSARERVSCHCGWKGRAFQLLCRNEDDLLFCPQCESSWTWIFD